jgi:hypothetical protein
MWMAYLRTPQISGDLLRVLEAEIFSYRFESCPDYK